MTNERIADLHRNVELDQMEPNEGWLDVQDYADLLAILDEKAEQLKAGEVVPLSVSPEQGETIKAKVRAFDERKHSPALSDADERAFAALWTLIEYVLKQDGDYFNSLTDAAFKAHWHLRRRLAKPAPLHGDVMCEVCGAIGHLLPAPIVDPSADIPKPVPPAGTTDGTLTFKMPQATTVTPAIKDYLTTEERREMVEDLELLESAAYALTYKEEKGLALKCYDAIGRIRSRLSSPPEKTVSRIAFDAACEKFSGHWAGTVEDIKRLGENIFHELGIAVAGDGEEEGERQ